MLNVPVLSRGRGGTGGHDFMSIKDNIKSLNFRISPINARGEFECRQVVFWGTGIKRLGTPELEEDLCETLYAQQYSTNFGVYYDIVDPTVRSTKKL